MALIDKRAALREQFPKARVVMQERPGTLRDRANREYWEADNRARCARGVHPDARAEMQERDADRFIAEMKQREQERFLARMNERKTA